MSRIDDLIQELCPDGVEHTGVLDIADYVRGITYSKNDEDSAGEIQVLRANNITLASNTLNFEEVKRVSSHVRVREAQRLRAGDTLICAGSGSRDHIGKVAYIREDIEQTFGGFMAVLRTTDARVESRFLFHLLTGERFKTHLDRSLSTSTINNLNAGVMRGFRVPVPPLEVQREIVRVLDKFTQLEAELEAELEARRAQYTHYRQAMLDQVDAPRVSLADLGSWLGGMTPSKQNAAYWDGGDIPWLASMDVSDESTNEIRGRVTARAIQETSLKVVSAPSIPVVMRSNILRRTLPVGFVDVDTTVNQDIRALVVGDGVDARYAYQVLRADSERIREQCVRTDGSMAAVSSKSFFAWKVPLPSLTEQRRIAGALDEFDALVNDISVGLPAELAARRKQYEHYRDRLLTFKELAS